MIARECRRWQWGCSEGGGVGGSVQEDEVKIAKLISNLIIPGQRRASKGKMVSGCQGGRWRKE